MKSMLTHKRTVNDDVSIPKHFGLAKLQVTDK